MTYFFQQNNKEIIISFLFILLLVTFLDPFMVLMPSSGVYIAIALLVVLFVVFAGLAWREQPQDERDELHRMIAGRIGYLLGTGVLVLGVLIESLQGHVDSWLVFGLGAMVAGKLAGLMWSKLRH